MAVEEVLHYETNLQLLICKVHGFGVHPDRQAIIRHLRGPGHELKGLLLRKVLSGVEQLPLRKLDSLLNGAPSYPGNEVVDTIPNLAVLEGWTCLPCNGLYLTTSAELIRKHAVARHGYKRSDRPVWERAELQTLFRETKVRRYFRVTKSSYGATTASIKISDAGTDQGLREVIHVSLNNN